MFIIEGRTAGVLAALATAAAMVILGDVRGASDVVESPTTADSTTALVTASRTEALTSVRRQSIPITPQP